ncbi:MAG TPA: YceI family protein [Myxococcaceae bacterium]|nr:YceI family protein [Myxococcaceae bacterium]
MGQRLPPLALAALAVSSVAGASTWDIDPAHSAAQFNVRHMMVSNVKGEFGKMTGSVNLDEKEIGHSTAQATIDTTTINSREPNRDKDLKSPNFFDVEKYPTITFKSTSFKKVGPEKYKVAGDLTIHGVTKPVVLDVEAPEATTKDPKGNERRGATATTTINRKDFGLTWNKPLETGGVMVGDQVTINIDLELVKKAAEKAAKTN